MTPLLFVLACLPAPDDPEEAPVLVSRTPPPVREAAQQSVRTVHLSVRNPQIAAVARGVAPVGVSVEGARLTVTVPWVPRARAGVEGWALPAPFQSGVTPAALVVDGSPCPIAADGPCALDEGWLWRAGAAPKQASFDVAPGIAAREAELRGATAWYGGATPAAYELSALGGPVVALQSGAARVTLETAPEGAELAFLPVRAPSAVWQDLSPPLVFSLKQPDPAGDRVLWSAEVPAGPGVPVRVALDEAARKSWTQWVFSAATTPAQTLGSVAVLASGQLLENKP